MILVTGASGFIGKSLCRRLHQAGRPVVAALRRRNQALDSFSADQVLLELTEPESFSAALAGCHTVIHLAARVHVMRDKVADSLAAYRSANVDATLNLAWRAAQQGVARFVFASSAKVNGEISVDRPFSPLDPPAPSDGYALSKWEAEQGLHHIAKETGLEVVIVRPPLVYGPGVRANFLHLLRLVRSGWPVPLGAIRNRRSMVALDNLTDLLAVCAEHPAAAGRTFMVSDDFDVSTAELVRILANAMDKRINLLPMPASILAGAAKLAGRSADAAKLLGSLQLDISCTKEVLGWRPVVEMHHALRETVEHFLAHQ